jgi:predicted O-methyltransferase YrrM
MRKLLKAVSPGTLPVLADKVVTRLMEPSPAAAAASAARWLDARAVDSAAFRRALHQELATEAAAFADRLHESFEDRVPAQYRGMGGGGDYALLYLLVRLRRPTVVVETGVAQGWTSEAILSALHVNGHGHLWSSDFPYWRMDSPEDGIGLMVDPAHRERWTLHTKGDQINLPIIVAEAGPIDLLHYDSDKSVRGRRRAMGVLEPRLSARALVVFDDVNDNDAFQRFVAARPWEHRVLAYRNKKIGITGPGCEELPRLDAVAPTT